MTTEGFMNYRPSLEPASLAKDTISLTIQIKKWLEKDKAFDIVIISLKEKSAICDYMIIASARSTRHVNSVSNDLRLKVKKLLSKDIRVEGHKACDWVIIDAGDIVINIFRPEVREFYNLERMWQEDHDPEGQSSGQYNDMNK